MPELTAIDARMWRFPDRSTSIGQAINAYLAEETHMDDAVIHMLFVANRLEKRQEMLRLLAGGTTLVVDRYSYSGVAYSAAKGLPHLPLEYLRSLEVLLPAADLVLHMAMSPEATAARGGYGQERYEKVEFQAKVMEAFEALRDERWSVIDAAGSIEGIHAKARIPVQRWCFPDRTTLTGQFIDKYLKSTFAADDAAVHLMFAANRFEKRPEMLRLLAGGTTLVVDRYSYSGVAYSAAKGLPHLTADYCRAVEAGLPGPDLLLYMDIQPEAAAARGGYGGERYEKLDFQKQVSREYARMRDPGWTRLDAGEPVEQLHAEVLTKALEAVERAAGGARLGRLWDLEPVQLPDP
ncbi:hypothetical protein GPECTOR_1g820 [Gonium pectorale]|uniref:dTMP kinase n=1 Tax=Gonium pectorale TaxID=33097 RepID=A0A150H5K8_GONPE|nr:hypothetical protein GPECTOR_1g820 [Gonium pectorale]|eukprot:KXZ56910.1 hypothetical protein GPECTOR_1g820 [Gonium pectorale]